MGSGVGIVIAVLAAYAAEVAARRKGRHPRRWMIACVVFSPALFLLEVLPSRMGSVDAVPVEPPSPSWLNKIPAPWVEVLGVVAVLLGLGWAAYILSQSDFPECASAAAHSEVSSLVKDKLNATIASYSSTQTLEAPSIERRCSATVVLGDNSSHMVYYRYYKDAGKIYVYAKFDAPFSDAGH